MTDTLLKIATWLVPLVIAIVFHEVAHGRVAKHFGDMTAHEQGRLTLNPLRHVDPIGTVILPMILALAHAPIFGWAKPVPVNPNRMRNPRWNMVAVAAAGPASNIVLATVSAAILSVVVTSAGGASTTFIVTNLVNFIAINLFLAVFNMIPIPPFDGSKVLAGFLPDGIRQRYQRLDRYAMTFAILLLVVIPQFWPGFNLLGRFVTPPVQWLFGAITSLFPSLG